MGAEAEVVMLVTVLGVCYYSQLILCWGVWYKLTLTMLGCLILVNTYIVSMFGTSYM
jgi:hypothetical protein